MISEQLKESLDRVEVGIDSLRDKALEVCALAEATNRENKCLWARNTELLTALKETLVWIDDPEAKQEAIAAIAKAPEKEA